MQTYQVPHADLSSATCRLNKCHMQT